MKNIIIIILFCIFNSFAEIPIFNHTQREMDETLFDNKMVFAAAESCGVNINADYIELYVNWGYVFVKVKEFKGRFKILQYSAIDAEWDNGKLCMYYCKPVQFDTVFKIDNEPPYMLHIKKMADEKEIVKIYDIIKNYLNENNKSNEKIEYIEKKSKYEYKFISRINRNNEDEYLLKKNKNGNEIILLHNWLVD
jgi:hypothetical protein